MSHILSIPARTLSFLCFGKNPVDDRHEIPLLQLSDLLEELSGLDQLHISFLHDLFGGTVPIFIISAASFYPELSQGDQLVNGL
jgi:hypothetical protein